MAGTGSVAGEVPGGVAGSVAGEATGEADTRLLARYARRAILLQVVLRGVLVAFVVMTLVVVPPVADGDISAAVAAGYGLLAATSSVWLLRFGRSARRFGWLVLYVDLAALTALTLVSTASDVNWTSNVMAQGLFLLPVLAATQLRPTVCAGVGVPTVVLSVVVAVITAPANGEPGASIAMRTVPLAALVVAAVGLSWIQRYRTAGIVDLARQRALLLAEVGEVERRERERLAEQLHDGALQYVLAARGDLQDLLEDGDTTSAGRLEEALTRSATLLRGTVSALHPAVLEQAGLTAALPALLTSAAERGRLAVELDTAQWPPHRRTAVDDLLHSTARELIGNAVKHARASRLAVGLALRDGIAVLTVTDDGVGMDATVRRQRLAQGHIGFDARRVRLEAAGGTLTVGTPPGGGCTVTATVPVPDGPSGEPHRSDPPR
jgi:two-component system NarL family sensor kinase